MRSWLVLTLLLLGACAPLPSVQETSADRLVFPGGWVEGRWVHGEVSFPLPAPPLDVDAVEDRIEVLFPYVWQSYRDGELTERHDLPAPARALRARPQPLVLLEDGVFTPEGGRRGYPARDAVRTRDGVYWIDDEGLWFERERLADGRFERVLAAGDEVVALARDHALRWPGERTLELPAEWFAADAAGDLYLLSPDGVHRLDLEGYELGFYPGAFEDLAASSDAGVWLLDEGGGVRHLDLRLEESW
ncbi:MAG TPA: hypothetical protein ENK37_09960 [Oceanithermus profundus]|uniref:Lipoprotein n=1 Tax=Oceanithermus profundus TaxID=187137 RepID=A0A7C4Z699_9DEIN|nr:hypothetical protein [Oceanithermus profundus]